MPKSKRPLKVFLGHAHSDKDAVMDLYTRLTNDGVDAWLDKEKLLPGQDRELEIRKAVREADVVVVCLSRQFNQAGLQQKEVRLALDTAMEKPEGEIFIIPARLEECDNLESLRKWQWVDLFEADGYKKLMSVLRMRADNIGMALVQTEKQQSSGGGKAMNTQNSQIPSSSEPPDMNADRDNSNISIQGNGNTVNIGETGSAKSKSSKKRAARSAQKKKKKEMNPLIVVALIGLVGVIITAVFSSPWIEKLLFPTSTPTASLTVSPETAPPATTAPAETEETAAPQVTLTVTEESPVPPTVPPAGLEKMFASLQASLTEGKAPLNVTFDARASYYQFADGTTAPCGNSILCSYTFSVYFNSQSLITADNKSGTFTYPFVGKGEYFVTVYVCRGTTCADDGLTVTVR